MLLILGICCGYFCPAPITYIATALLVVLIATWVLYKKTKHHFTQQPYFAIGCYLATFLLGWYAYLAHQDTLYASHYTHYKEAYHTPQKILITLTENLKTTPSYQSYLGTVQQIDTTQTMGTVLIYKKVGASANNLTGKQLWCYTTLNTIKAPLNPFQFNYAAYMQKKQVYAQINLKEGHYSINNTPATGLRYQAQQIRNTITENLYHNGLKEQELAVTTALFLGERQEVSPELYTNYINAGSIHLLAISGLHVSLLAMLLYYLFLPLRNYKAGIYISAVLILVILWFFAFITGLSASVTRAVLMFSLVTIAMHIKRPQNSLHIIFSAAFILLLIAPNTLFTVGFQLSYLAVIGIVVLQPKLANLITVKNKLLNYFYTSLTVMLSAQVFIIPVSLYYFHQYPLLFFVGNLVIVPLFPVLLGYGFILITLAYFNILSPVFVEPFAYGIRTMNIFINQLGTIKHSVVTYVYFDTPMLISIYLIILIGFYALIKKHAKVLRIALIGIALVQLYVGGRFLKNTKTESLIIFNNYGSHLLGIQKGTQLHVFTNDSLSTHNYVLDSYTTHTQTTVVPHKPQHYYQYNQFGILVIDKKATYKLPLAKVDYVVLTESPSINPERVFKTLQPKVIIADGSNYPNEIALWKSACNKHHIPFYDTTKEGAFILP
ncbi:competence protein ComEC [Neptunitalea chrysea]|uniref:Competence protein ComEC n=1 Tax=Neptunitalea chrysea TaxID=1647581 RepID=A0A9W6B6T4_9FLAO|nr:ComEC/Rec2 family competence protein [Neptunitalea chrysea]GLB53784.1 competence protein ComEC [Neptunitalea chrysea]